MAEERNAKRWLLPALVAFFAVIALGLTVDLAIALWSGEVHVFAKHGPSRRVLLAQDASAYWVAVTVRGAAVLVMAFTAGMLGNLWVKMRAGKPTFLDHIRPR